LVGLAIDYDSAAVELALLSHDSDEKRKSRKDGSSFA